MSSTFGTNCKITIFGESHGPKIGVVIDGLPAGIPIDEDFIAGELGRRRAVDVEISTARKEADKFTIVSGVYNGKTTGTPLCAECENGSQHSADYSKLQNLARPGHADYTGYVRYNGCNDPRGGGHFSGRLTAPLVFAGAVAKLYLQQKGVRIGAHVLSIGEINDIPLLESGLTPVVWEKLSKGQMPLIDPSKEALMKLKILQAKNGLDSIGGQVECVAEGMPAGIGSPMFEGLENKIAQAVFGIPAVKGISFGNGFDASKLYGSENNDAFFIDTMSGKIATKTNRHGGILGGISSGMPILTQVAFKPTPSIAQQQSTVDFKNNHDVALKITGRHDPCVVPRAVVCVESAVAVALMDAMLDGSAQ